MHLILKREPAIAELREGGALELILDDGRHVQLILVTETTPAAPYDHVMGTVLVPFLERPILERPFLTRPFLE